MEVATLGLKVDGSPVDKASSSLDRFSRSADKAERSSDGLQNSSRKTNKSLADAARSSDRAATSLSGLANAARIAGAAMAAIGVGAFASSTFQAVRSAQQLQASLKTVTGSVQEATVAWGNLLAFAEETPFTLEQSVQGFIRMKSLGLDPTNEALRSFGNTASAMGKDMMQMVEAVADATTGEFERLKEFGIRASKEGDQVSFTFQGVTTTVRNSSEAISRYLQDIGENQFAGAMADQMDTLGGKVSNLEDSIYQFYLAVGEEGATDVFSSALSAASRAVEFLTDNVSTLVGVSSALAGAVGALGAVYVTTTAATWALTFAQRALNIAARANPYVLAASALVAMTGALYGARNATVTLGETTVRVKDWIQAGWIEANDTLIRATGTAVDAATGFFGTFGDSVGSVTNYLWETFQALMGNIADVVQWGVNRVIGYFVGLPQIAAEVARGILAQFEVAFTNIGEFAAAIPEAISSMSTDPFKQVATNAAEEFKSSFSNSVSGIAGIVEESISRDYLGEASDAISESFASFGERVSDTAFRLRFLNNQTEEAAKGLDGLGGSSNTVEIDVDDLGNTITTLGDATKDAAGGTNELDSSMQSLLDNLFPLQAGLRQYKEDQILLNQAYIQGLISLDQYTEGLKRLREEQMLSQERPDQAYDILSGPTGMGQGEDEDQGGWDKWLESAQTAFTDFDSMAASTAENFQRGFGDAFESMIFDSQNFGDAMYNLFDGIARSLVSALGEMAAQWLAYQAVTAIIGNQGTEQAEQQAIQSGSQIASAYAPAAAMASLASFGQNAFPAIAGIAATNIAAQGFAGLFDNGGNIPAGQWGIAGERGPEIIQGPANITSRRDTADIMNGAQGGMPVDVRVTNNGEPKHAEARSRTEEGRLIIDIMLEDLAGDGRYARALQSGTNVQRRGR